MIKNVLDVFTNHTHGESMCTHRDVCEYTGICMDWVSCMILYDFIHIVAFLVFKKWPLILQNS